MKFILQEEKFVLPEKFELFESFELSEKFVLDEDLLLEKNRRKEARTEEQGLKLLYELIGKHFARIMGHGNYKVVNPEAARVPTLKDTWLKPDMRKLLASKADGWLQADEDNLEYWVQLLAQKLKQEGKLVVNAAEKTITIKSEEEEPETEEEPKVKFSLKETDLELKVGETAILKLLATPAVDHPVKAVFTSAAEAIATVSPKGEIVAVAAGETEIKVVVEEQTLTCKVKVIADEKPKTEYSLEESDLELKVGESATLKIKASPESDHGITASYKTANETIATVDDKGEIKAIAVGETEIRVTVEEQVLVAKIKVIEKDKTPEPPKTEELDWYELYKACGNSEHRQEAYEAFWNGGLSQTPDKNPRGLPLAPNAKAAMGYYKGEWGEQASVVRSFGTVFTNLLDKEGWTAKLNPFIDFLQYLFKIKASINDSAFSLLVKQYPNIVNEDDLRGTGKLEGLNLIRNSKFYQISSDEMLTYLNWQAKVRDTDKLSSKLTGYANIVWANGKVTTDNDLRDETALKTIFDSATPTQPKIQYEIRPLTQYKEVIKSRLGLDGDEKKAAPATDEEVKKILAKITTAEKAQKCLAYLVNFYRVVSINRLNKLFEQPFGDVVKKNRDSAHSYTTYAEDKEFDTIFNMKARTYSQKQLETLCAELAKKAGLDIPEKTEKPV